MKARLDNQTHAELESLLYDNLMDGILEALQARQGIPRAELAGIAEDVAFGVMSALDGSAVVAHGGRNFTARVGFVEEGSGELVFASENPQPLHERVTGHFDGLAEAAAEYIPQEAERASKRVSMLHVLGFTSTHLRSALTWDTEKQSNPPPVVGDQILKELKAATAGLAKAGKVKLTSSGWYVLDPSLVNCGRCAECDAWTSDSGKTGFIAAIGNGAVVKGRLLCEACRTS